MDLNWLYHFEGSSKVAGVTNPDPTSANASVISESRIYRTGGGPEGSDDILANVNFHLDLNLFDVSPGVGGATGYLTGFQQWSGSSNLGFSLGDYTSYSQEYFGTSNEFSKTVYVDSANLGISTIPFQVLVGETIDIELDLDLFSSVSGGAELGSGHQGFSRNDYFNTLASQIQFGGAYQGLGLQLQFDPVDGAQAPEPATMLVAGLGLVVIGFWRRRVRG